MKKMEFAEIACAMEQDQLAKIVIWKQENVNADQALWDLVVTVV